MIEIRKSDSRGHVRIDWLDSRHSFSFGEYFDPQHVQFGPLRVINEDHVAPGAGFPPHPHRDMEIVTWVLSGALAHKDSTGGEGVIRPGEVQRMSAGTGIRHSEYNASADEGVHLLQIWLLPSRAGLAPGYEQKDVSQSITGRLGVIASPDGRDGSVTIGQDATIYAARLAQGETVSVEIDTQRRQWVQVARGAVRVNDTVLLQGDGAALTQEHKMRIGAEIDAEVLVFDMA